MRLGDFAYADVIVIRRHAERCGVRESRRAVAVAVATGTYGIGRLRETGPRSC